MEIYAKAHRKCNLQLQLHAYLCFVADMPKLCGVHLAHTYIVHKYKYVLGEVLFGAAGNV